MTKIPLRAAAKIVRRKNQSDVARTGRLAPEDRKQLIVEEATNFFAEHGFEGGTMELAKRLGISQPLLYRYFPTKGDLISHVYEHAFPSAKYYAKWTAELDDESVPVRERLINFYCEYMDVLLNYKFLRLAIWARLSDSTLNAKYNEVLTSVIYPKIVRALKQACKLPVTAPPEQREIELVQSLHGSIYYVGVRRLDERLPKDVRDIVISKIDVFLSGILAVLSAGATVPAEKSSAAAGQAHAEEPRAPASKRPRRLT